MELSHNRLDLDKRHTPFKVELSKPLAVPWRGVFREFPLKAAYWLLDLPEGPADSLLLVAVSDGFYHRLEERCLIAVEGIT